MARLNRYGSDWYEWHLPPETTSFGLRRRQRDARGVDVEAQAEAQMFAAPEQVVAQGIKDLYGSDRAARRIMQRHSGGEEMRRIFLDVELTAEQLGVDTPVLGSLRPFVEGYAPVGA